MDDEINKVIEACEKYGFSYHVAINGIFIRTVSVAGWFILLNGEKPELMHENYRRKNKYGHGMMEEYHHHTDIKETTAEGMVEYIKVHDKSMLRTRKNTIFDKLNLKGS